MSRRLGQRESEQCSEEQSWLEKIHVQFLSCVFFLVEEIVPYF
jgi:hypothetical protein